MITENEDYSEGRARYKAFMLLTGALALILIGCTVCLWFGKMNVADYEKVLQMLGVPTLLGMAFHAFFVENSSPKGGDNVQKIDANTVSVGGPGAAGGPGTSDKTSSSGIAESSGVDRPPSST